MEHLRGLFVEVRRRRVLEVVAIYGGLGFAMLQGADIVIPALNLPATLLTALTVLVLLGLPVAAVVGWIYDVDSQGRLSRTPPAAELEPDEDEASRPFRWTGLLAAAAVGTLLLATSWLVALRLGSADPAYAVEDPRGSYLVAPLGLRSDAADDASLADHVARRLTRQLRGWETLRTVTTAAYDGMASKLGLEQDDLPSLSQARDMAKSQRAGSLIGLELDVDGDSLYLEALLYDVAEDEEFGSPILTAGPADDLDGLVAPIAQWILQIRDQETSIEELRRESPNPNAHQDFDAGLEALRNWHLSEAERQFRSAIERDSLFTNALHYLALTLYWQTARESRLVLENGPEIARLTQAANRALGSRSVRPGFRDHIEAFRAFWEGEYDVARDLYARILAVDSSDVEAWLLLGAVELEDPLLESTLEGLTPRRNLNLARRAFETAADIAPDWQLAYGMLFDIDRALLDAARNERCPGFDPPETRPRPPFMQTKAATQVGFCPVVDDSIEWIPHTEFSAANRTDAIERADSLAQRSRELIETWAQIHPEQARPHEELANWLTWRRSNLGCQQDSASLRQITRNILRERERALELRGDTMPADLLRLAMLRLAADDVDEARRLLNEGMTNIRDETVPPETANILVALGKPDTAIALSRPQWSTWSWGTRDPDGGPPILAGDVAEPIVRIRLRAAAGDVGESLRAPFERLFDTWSGPEYSASQSAHLRSLGLRLGLGPGLAMNPDVRRRWFSGWEAAGLEVPVLWRGFLAADSAAGTEGDLPEVGRALDAELARLRTAETTSAENHFLAGLLAQITGRHEAAVDQLKQIESCPLSLHALSEGWGLRTMARWYRARSSEALGNRASASEAMAAYSAYRRTGSTEVPHGQGNDR
ncbi:MAG TPA: hypothetical protein VLA33_00155 [Gemmatimonadota bacterium]|nr:hypothetical protein [Gemmatimonadota bacterium]